MAGYLMKLLERTNSAVIKKLEMCLDEHKRAGMHSNYTTLALGVRSFQVTPGSFPIVCRCAAVALVSLRHARKNSSNPSPKVAQDCPKPGRGKGKWPHQSVMFSSVCFSETVFGLAKQPCLGPYVGCGRGGWFKQHKTQSWWPEHETARPSCWLPGTRSQSAARAKHPLSTPHLPLKTKLWFL